MITKVTPRDDDDAELASRRAALLKFLVGAQRGITLQSVAREHGTQRSNLSAYISSRGQRRSIALERLRSILFSLGAHWDFTLRRERRFHRWDLGRNLKLVPGLESILEANRATRVRVMPTTGNQEAFVVFVAFEAEAICFIRVQQPILDAVFACFGFASDQPVVEASLSDAVQSAWLTEDPDEAMEAVRKLLADHSACVDPRGAVKGRLVAAG